MSEGSGRADAAIVRAAIYPAIGIARLGNSESAYFLAPEVTDPPPEPPGFYRDPTGALKRQAARFRVYGVDVPGEVAGADRRNVEIPWTVHLANLKSAWYHSRSRSTSPRRFGAAILLRNDDRRRPHALAIDPGPRNIAGRDTAPARPRFDDGALPRSPGLSR